MALMVLAGCSIQNGRENRLIGPESASKTKQTPYLGKEAPHFFETLHILLDTAGSSLIPDLSLLPVLKRQSETPRSRVCTIINLAD